MNGDLVNGINKQKSDGESLSTNDVEASKSDVSIAGRSSTTAEAVQGLRRALLQICQMIEPKFLQQPLGEDEATRTRKQKEALELQLQGLTPRKIKEQVWEGAPAVTSNQGGKTKKQRQNEKTSLISDDDEF